MAIEHLPPGRLQLNPSARLYFLAGPIQGAPDWQGEAFGIIDAVAPNQAVHVANPRRNYIDGTFDYERQASWEDLGRERSGLHGALIFWLAARDYSLPYEEGRPYGQTTRFEFAEAYGWLRKDHTVQIAIGIERGYEGSERYYRHQARRFALPVYDNLEATCLAALKARRPSRLL